MSETTKEKIWIGDKKVKEMKDTGEKTPGGSAIFEVEFVNGAKEVFSQLMLDAALSEEACDATALRDKRVYPVVGSTLAIMREYGMKIGETAYFSVLVNQSLNTNRDAAEKELWRKNGAPTIKGLDDVDMITIDRILKSIKGDAIVSPPEFYGKTAGEEGK